MNDKTKLIAAGVFLLLAGIAIGRYTKPDKVRIEKQVVQTETKDKQEETKIQTDRDKHTTTITVEIKKPDGTIETKTKTRQDDTVRRDSDTTLTEKDTKFTKTQESTEIENNKNSLNLSFLAGAKFKNTQLHEGYEQGPFCYGGQIQKRVIGPFSLGAWGLSCGQGGLSLGVSF